MTELLAEYERKAAHGRHVCALCGKRIAVGERYSDARCADAGTAWTFRSHLRCRAIANAHCDGEIIGYVQDMLDGHAYECAGATNPDFVGCDCALEQGDDQQALAAWSARVDSEPDDLTTEAIVEAIREQRGPLPEPTSATLADDLHPTPPATT